MKSPRVFGSRATCAAGLVLCLVPLLAGATALVALVIVQHMTSESPGPRVVSEAALFSHPGRVIVIRYGESSTRESPRRSGEETLFGGLVLDDPR